MTPETELKHSIKQYLSIKRYFFWYNLAGIGAYKGLPDIFVLHDNILYGIEVKTKKGVVSPHQKEFLDKLSEYGGVPIIARDIDDVMKYL